MATNSRSNYNDIWSKMWGDVQEFGPTHTHIRRMLFSLARQCEFSSVLDAGCGNGVNMRFFLDRFPAISRIAGFDISDVALKSAEKKCPDADLAHLDIQKERLDAQFDLVYSCDVLEHIPDDVAALGNLYAMTGRYLLVSTLQGRMRKFEEKIGHVRNYQKGELEQKIVDAGYSVKRKIQWGWPFFSPLYRNLLNTGSMNDYTSRGTGLARRTASISIYCLFLCNSSKRGDYIFVLAEKRNSSASFVEGG